MRRFEPIVPAALLLVASIVALAPAASGRGENLRAGAADTLFVALSGNDSDSCHTATAACRTISAAVAKSGGNGTIHVAAGTYTEHLTLGTVNLAIVGAGSGTTAIDGGCNGQVINWDTLASGGSTLSISDITIQNGCITTGGGAGLSANGQVSLTLSRVVFNANTCLYDLQPCLGGGLYFFGIALTATDVSFVGNAANYGGGIFFQPRDLTVQSVLTSVTFANNTGYYYLPGALYVMNTYPPVNGQSPPPPPIALIDATFTANTGGDVVLCRGAVVVTGVTPPGFAVAYDSAPVVGAPCSQ